MIDIVADLHLHSKYSRAVSPQMTPSVMAQVGAQKGLDILATGDFTHPLWTRELKSQLEESEEGLYKLKGSGQARMTRFLLSVEIACIYSQGGKGRRIHNLVFAPNFEVAEKINKELISRGFNLSSDGRPIIGLSSKNLLELILTIDEKCLLIPAHIWTPWFGIYGQMSGFNSLDEAFVDLSSKIYGIETGLSSDPEMNWQIKELNTRSILSFSDAHSPAKMGREATVFRLESLSYDNIRKAIMQSGKNDQRSTLNDQKNKVLYTIEFYPEEGKYHYSGHRNCNISLTPDEIKKNGNICPVCKRPVTDGVMRRVMELTTQEIKSLPKPNSMHLKWITSEKENRVPFVKLVPLLEIIAEAIGSPVGSPKVKVIFDELTQKLNGEIEILLKTPIEKIKTTASTVTNLQNAEKISEGVEKVREGNIVIKPGYDGVYGVVKIWQEEKNDQSSIIDDQNNKNETEKKEQIGMNF